MTTGVTIFGIIRKRMDDLLREFNERIKKDASGGPNGAFGAVTTLDTPDIYPSDPLVQLATTASASDHEVWEAVEFFYAQLDPRAASGIWLEKFHGEPRFGLKKEIGQTWDEYQDIILGLIDGGVSRYDASVIALKQPDIDCARQLISTINNPISGLPAPGSMLVVKGCDIDYSALAASVWENTEIGVYDWYGDETVNYQTENDGCFAMKFQPASRIFIDVQIFGYFTAGACEKGVSTLDVTNEAVERLKAAYSGCDFGQNLKSSNLRDRLAGLTGFVVTDVKLRRRAKKLYYDGCDFTDAPQVEVCGEVVHWASYDAAADCFFIRGEEWCDDRLDCLQLNAWEFPDFDLVFSELVEVSAESC